MDSVDLCVSLRVEQSTDQTASRYVLMEMEVRITASLMAQAFVLAAALRSAQLPPLLRVDGVIR